MSRDRAPPYKPGHGDARSPGPGAGRLCQSGAAMQIGSGRNRRKLFAITRKTHAHGYIYSLCDFRHPWAFFLQQRISAHGAMSMLHVHVRCRDKPSACLLWTRPSSRSARVRSIDVREIDVRGINLRTPALPRAILTAPKTSNARASLRPGLISTFRGVLASR